MRTAAVILLLVAVLVLPACQMNERMSGTLFGAVGGGVIGGAAGGAGGAVIGVLGGGVVGYLIGDYMADRRERGRTEVFETNAPAFSADRPVYAAGAVMGVKRYAAAPTAGDAARAAYENGRKARTASEARRHFEESLRLDPTRPEPWNALGLNALHRGEPSQAEAHWLKAAALDPSYYPARHNLARHRTRP
jgi:hypothetical protein